MQTNSHQLRDPLIDVIGYKVVCEVRNTSNFKLSLVHWRSGENTKQWCWLML